MRVDVVGSGVVAVAEWGSEVEVELAPTFVYLSIRPFLRNWRQRVGDLS